MTPSTNVQLAPGIGSGRELFCDLLVVPACGEGWRESPLVRALDERLGGLLLRAADEERFKPRGSASLVLHTHGRLPATRLALLGLERCEPGLLRDLGARALRASQGVTARHLAVSLEDLAVDPRGVQLVGEGLLLGSYRFDRYWSEESRRLPLPTQATLLGEVVAAAPLKRAEVVARATLRARDLVNEPAAEMTPRRFVDAVRPLADAAGLETTVLGPGECRALGMGLFLAVAQGSDEEPRFLHLVHRPPHAARRVCLVGKGITFDSGGLSLKPTASMLTMKTDMAGAAAVVAAALTLAELGCPVEVHAVVALCENMPSGKAMKLGDVYRGMSGRTVEITNTDAEGRLLLADALHFAAQKKPDEIIDLATLTGACVVALGPHIAGVFSTSPELSGRLQSAAARAGEELWPLPLPERLAESLKSEVADTKNTGEREGGALVAALFLREFVGKVPWLHLDIAGPATAEKEHGAHAKGATGFGVATLVEYLTS